METLSREAQQLEVMLQATKKWSQKRESEAGRKACERLGHTIPKTPIHNVAMPCDSKLPIPVKIVFLTLKTNNHRNSHSPWEMVKQYDLQTWQTWREMWFTGPSADALRAQWGNTAEGQKAYLENAAYLGHQEQGMQVFRLIEARALRQARWVAYHRIGKAMMDKAVAAFLSPQDMPFAEPDFIFASIDVDGNIGARCNMINFGIATLDTRSWREGTTSASPSLDINTFNIVSKPSRHNLWGTQVSVKPHELKDHILGSLHIPDRQYGNEEDAPLRKIVLVGHGVEHDIKRLECLGIMIEELPVVVGIVDTVRMARDVLEMRHGPTLQKLLDLVRIPCTPESLHCAANDAHYALRAALAMVKTQHATRTKTGLCAGGSWDYLDKLIKQSTEEPRVRIRDEDVEWTLEEFDELDGDLFAAKS